MPRILQGCLVQTVFLEELPERHFGNAKFPSTRDEVEQFVACGLGMGEEEFGDRAGMTRQEFSVRATAEVIVNLPANLLRGEFSMAKCGSRADAYQTRDLGNLQPYAAVQQEMACHARTGVVPVARPEESKRRLKHGSLLSIQPLQRNFRLPQPHFECLTFLGHCNASLTATFPVTEV